MPSVLSRQSSLEVPVKHKGIALRGVLVGGLLAVMASAQALAGSPATGTQPSVHTPQEAANYAVKVAVAAEIETALGAARSSLKSPVQAMPCPNGCDAGGSYPYSWSLEVRARQQYRSYWCGPAAGQIVINWSRGIIIQDQSKAAAESLAVNYKKQSTIAGWMGTTSTDGTWGGSLASALNRSDAVLKPVSYWIYSWAPSGTLSQFMSKVLADVYAFEMPLVLPVVVHKPGSAYFLSSWPTANDAHHYVVISGYQGTSSTTSVLTFKDSSGTYGGGTGTYTDTAETMWKANSFNNGYVVW